MRTTFGIIRVVGFAAIIAAIIGQGINTAIFFGANGKGDNAVGHSLVNFVSFFTIESNIIAAATFAIGAWVLLRTKGDGPAWFATLRLSAVTYMTITGLVYNLLLRGYALPQGRTLEWANEVFHVVMPIIVLLDFLLAPGRVRLDFKKIRLIIIFPIAWCAYTLIRAPFALDPSLGTAPWYPYPFLDPQLSHNGYVSVAFYIIVIALVICSIAAGAIWVSHRRDRWPLPALK